MLKNRDSILSNITMQLHAYDDCKLGNIRVRLFADGAMVKEYLGLVVALAQIVEGLYWDDEGDWSNADSAVVDTY